MKGAIQKLTKCFQPRPKLLSFYHQKMVNIFVTRAIFLTFVQSILPTMLYYNILGLCYKFVHFEPIKHFRRMTFVPFVSYRPTLVYNIPNNRTLF